MYKNIRIDFKNPRLVEGRPERNYWADFRNGMANDINGVEVLVNGNKVLIDVVRRKTGNPVSGGLCLPLPVMLDLSEQLLALKNHKDDETTRMHMERLEAWLVTMAKNADSYDECFDTAQLLTALIWIASVVSYDTTRMEEARTLVEETVYTDEEGDLS